MVLSNNVSSLYTFTGQPVPRNHEDLLITRMEENFKSDHSFQGLSLLLMFVTLKAEQFGLSTFRFKDKLSEFVDYLEELANLGEVVINYLSVDNRKLCSQDLTRIKHLDALKEKADRIRGLCELYYEMDLSKAIDTNGNFEEVLILCEDLLSEIISFKECLQEAGVDVTKFTVLVKSVLAELKKTDQVLEDQRPLDQRIYQNPMLLYPMLVYRKLLKIAWEGIEYATQDNQGFDQRDKNFILSVDLKKDLDLSEIKLDQGNVEYLAENLQAEEGLE